MKNPLLLAAIVLSCAVTVGPRASAQSAMFTYTGVPVAPLTPGSSFTIQVSLMFTSGGNISDLSGLSYWWSQTPGPNSPFSITNRTATGLFTDLQSGLVYPQIIDPINRNPNGTQTSTDLGALITAGTPGQPSGTYPIASLTFQIAANAPPSIWTLGNTTSTTPGVGGRISVITDSDGDTFPIAASPFILGVLTIPEPSSIALMVVGAVGFGLTIYIRRRTRA